MQQDEYKHLEYSKVYDIVTADRLHYKEEKGHTLSYSVNKMVGL